MKQKVIKISTGWNEFVLPYTHDNLIAASIMADARRVGSVHSVDYKDDPTYHPYATDPVVVAVTMIDLNDNETYEHASERVRALREAIKNDADQLEAAE